MYIIEKRIKIGNFVNNGIKGYAINIHLKFNNKENNKVGYLNLSAGFEKVNDFSSFINREYRGIPFAFNRKDNLIIAFEIFDTKKFIDTEIQSEVTLKLGDIFDNKIETIFEVNDEIIKINFQGDLDIVSIT